MDRGKQRMMQHYTSTEDREIVAKIYEKADRAFQNQKFELTDFLDPHQQDIAERVINSFPEVTAVFHGGFINSERKKVGIFPAFWNLGPEDLGIDVLSLGGNFNFATLSHRDVLGALMSLGLRRDKLGDIFLEEDTAYVAVDHSVSKYVMDNLVQVKNVGVQVTLVDKEILAEETDYTKEISGTVSSLRLDAVSSTGFGISRSKMAGLIKAERVKLNWRPTKDPKASVKEGDVISLRGKGRVEVSEVGGISRKGRYHLTLRRFK